LYPGLSSRIDYLAGVADIQIDRNSATSIFLKLEGYERELSKLYLEVYNYNKATGITSTLISNKSSSESSSKFASFFSRAAAIIIDFYIIMGFVELLLVFIFKNSSDDFRAAGWLGSWLIYSTMMEGSALQATIGKKIMGLKVINRHGFRMKWINSIGRNLAKIISFSVLGGGFLKALFDKSHQTIHDFYAKTYVVSNKTKK